MKIKKKLVVDFLKKVRINELEKVLLQFTDDGLLVSASDSAEIRIIRGLLDKSNFEEYTAIGEVGVSSLSSIISIFNKMDEDLEFSVEGNLMTATAKKKKVSIELTDSKFIENTAGKKDMNPETTFDIELSDFQKFVEDIKVNDDTKITFTTVDDGVILKNGKNDKYKFEYNLDAKGAKKGFCSKFGAPLITGLDKFKTGEVTIGLGNDYPIIVTEKTDAHEIQLIVAPQVET